MIDWTKYKNFKKEEFNCKHTGLNEMDKEFLDKLQDLRTAFGKPMVITSGYRHATHPIERAKSAPGPHTTGKAADVAVQGPDAWRLLYLAMNMGFTGIGVQQKGNGRYLHLDTIKSSMRPTIWSY